MKRIDSELTVRVFQIPVEDVPLARLRCDVILGCVDSRRARLTINQASRRIGVPWIDAGVNADGQLTRVQTFLTTDDRPCLECAWDEQDYRLVEQVYACQAADAAAAAPTGASATLGCLAASLMTLECERLLSCDIGHLLDSQDLVVDARSHRSIVTRYARNAECRMPDHARWRIVPSRLDPALSSVKDLISKATPRDGGDIRLRVAGQQFALALRCTRCSQQEPCAHLHRGAFRDHPPACQRCGGPLNATGLDLYETVAWRALPDHVRRRTLSDFGFVDGDVVTVETDEGDVHLELGDSTCPTRS
jgi:hypothetical protein